MLTFPVAVSVNGKVKCIPYIEKDELFHIKAEYLCRDRDYSGYEIYRDIHSNQLYAVDSR